jgi:hypothetical protein
MCVRHRGEVMATALLPSVQKRPVFNVNVVESDERRERSARRLESIISIRSFRNRSSVMSCLKNCLE